MKAIYILVFLMVGILSKAQTFGASALDVKSTYDSSNPVHAEWLRLGKSATAKMTFAQTPNGVSEATTLVQRMLLENDLSFESPDIFNSIEGKDIINNNNNRNPDIMNSSIQKGNSIINLAWNAKDGSILQLLLTKNAYEVIVMKAYK